MQDRPEEKGCTLCPSFTLQKCWRYDGCILSRRHVQQNNPFPTTLFRLNDLGIAHVSDYCFSINEHPTMASFSTLSAYWLNLIISFLEIFNSLENEMQHFLVQSVMNLKRGCSSIVVSALVSKAEGRGFEPKLGHFFSTPPFHPAIMGTWPLGWRK